MSLTSVVAKALVWTSLESFALSGLSLISLVVFARLLSADQFGSAALALAIVQVLAVPVDLLFHDALIQRKDLEQSHINSAFTVSVGLGVFSCGLCWVSAGLVARALHEPRFAEVLQWMSLSLVGMGFGSVLVAMQRRRLEFRSLAIRSLGGRVGSAVIAMTMAFMGAGVWSLVAQQVLLVCLGTLTLWLLAEERPRFQFVWPRVRELLPFGMFTTMQQLLAVCVPRAFMLLVGGYLGSKSVGLLSLAFRGLDMLRDLLAQAVSQVAMPLFSRIQGERAALDLAYQRAVALTAFVTYPIFVGLGACAEEVVLVVFGKQWLDAAPYFTVVALLTLPFFLRMYAGSFLKALGKPAAPGVELVVQALYLVPMMLLVGRHSVNHAMLVWGSRLALSTPIDMWVQRRLSGMSFAKQLNGAVVPALAALAMAAGVLVVKSALGDWPAALRLVAMASAGATLYGAIALVANRELAKQLVALVGKSIQTRS